MFVRLITASLFCISLLSSGAMGQVTSKIPSSETAQPQGLHTASDTAILDKADLDAWLDGHVPYALAASDIAGAVVVVVKDGQVLTERGYGYADVQSRREVNPQSTMFRTGSVGKLFTWTAVMQQVEAGKIDLDVDVNRYLDFTVPPRDGKPITMRNLMTHTSGFEEHLKRLFVGDADRLQPLDVYMKAWLPARVYLPGEVPAYSNYGAAMAGYIVQRVSGEPFDDYIQRHILDPLGMEHSTFREPLPASLRENMATGYPRASEPPRDFEFVNPHPVGSLSATGDDMGRFMIAHLQNGEFAANRILQTQTALEMHAEQKNLNPPLGAMALGFFHSERNGHPVIGHGGDTAVFHTDLQLLVNDNVGIFVSVNSAGTDFAESFRESLVNGFIDRYFPAASAEVPTTSSAKEHAKLMAGRYWPSRRGHSSFFRLANLLRQSTVSTEPDGTLVVSSLSDYSGAPIRWREVAPFVWVDDARNQLVALTKDGRVENFASGGFGAAMVMQRVPGWANANWNMPLLYFVIGTLLLTLILWPIVWALRKHYGVTIRFTGRRASLYLLVRVVALIDLLAFAAYAFVLSRMMNAHYLDSPIDPWLRLAQILSLTGSAGALLAVWNVIAVSRDQSATRWVKAGTALLGVACFAFAWFAISLHLISLSTQF